MTGSERPGVLLMTYGSPTSLEREDIRAYLARVRAGREPDPELVDEFTRRYRVIGGSPLIEITRGQASALAESLGWPVEVGMRFSEPSIVAGLRALAEAGVTKVAAIILSPQYSPLLMSGYGLAIDEGRATLGARAPNVSVAGAWHDEPAFVAALARRVVEALARLSPEDRRAVRVLMTAHSLPKRVADQEPDYLAQLRATAEAVAMSSGLSDRDWTFCWQSAGHEPGEWMKPDFADLMPEIAASGGRAVLVVPVQFLADHLETLYDIDVGAREQAVRWGLAFHRIGSPNADPDFVESLAAVAHQTLKLPFDDVPAGPPIGPIVGSLPSPIPAPTTTPHPGPSPSTPPTTSQPVASPGSGEATSGATIAPATTAPVQPTAEPAPTPVVTPAPIVTPTPLPTPPVAIPGPSALPTPPASPGRTAPPRPSPGPPGP